jgi:hypothetical protein
MSDLMAKIVHLEECDSFLIEIIESACEQMQCEFLEAPLRFFLCSCNFTCYNFFTRQVLGYTPSMRNVGFLDELRLLKGHHLIPTPFGLICGVVAPLFSCKIVLNILESPSIIVKNL